MLSYKDLLDQEGTVEEYAFTLPDQNNIEFIEEEVKGEEPVSPNKSPPSI